MIPKCWGISVAAAACVTLFGCAGGSAEDSFSGALTGPCVPGQAAACVCPDGTTSARTCAPDGASYNLCACYYPGAAGAAAGIGNAGSASVSQPGAAGTGPLAGMMAPLPGASGSGAGGVTGTMMPRAGSSAPTGGAGGMSMIDAGMPMAGGGAVTPPDGGSVMPGDEVPASEHCAPVASWDPAWVEFEDEVLRLVNENRAMGWNCDTEGQFGAAPPLTTQPNLRCSARLHSQDMNVRDFFDHNNPDGDGPSERMDAAGYMGGTWGENIAMGQRTPQQVVDGWMESDGHCANIMRAQFTQIGVGFFQGADRSAFYWTQNFGAPCTGRFCM